MTAQLSLLTDTPRSRRSDPETSHKAAQRIKDIGALAQQQRLVLMWLREHPGLTSAELARLMAIRQHRNPVSGRSSARCSAGDCPSSCPPTPHAARSAPAWSPQRSASPGGRSDFNQRG